jgi:hypothetical protein
VYCHLDDYGSYYSQDSITIEKLFLRKPVRYKAMVLRKSFFSQARAAHAHSFMSICHCQIRNIYFSDRRVVTNSFWDQSGTAYAKRGPAAF